MKKNLFLRLLLSFFLLIGVHLNQVHAQTHRLYVAETASPSGSKIFYTNDDNVEVASMTISGTVNDLAVDAANGYVFWIEDNAIYRADLELTGSTLVKGSLTDAVALAVDPDQQIVYYVTASSGTNTVQATKYDGTFSYLPYGNFTGSDDIKKMALSQAQNTLYFSCVLNNQLYAYEIGSGLGVQPITSITNIYDLDIDDQDGMLYYSQTNGFIGSISIPDYTINSPFSGAGTLTCLTVNTLKDSLRIAENGAIKQIASDFSGGLSSFGLTLGGTLLDIEAYTNESPEIVGGNIDSVSLNEDFAPYATQLHTLFNDDQTDPVDLSYQIEASNNISLLNFHQIVGNELILYSLTNAFGDLWFLISATDKEGLSVQDTIFLTIEPVMDPPSTSSPNTFEDVMTDTINVSGVPGDQPSPSHYQITSISNGTLYRADGVTEITNGELIPVAEAHEGFRFMPAANSILNGTFFMSSYSSSDGSTSVSSKRSVIVRKVNDAPSFTPGSDISLNEDNGAYSESNWATAMSAGPADESSQTLTFHLQADDPSMFAVQPQVDPSTGELTFTSAQDKNGSTSVSIWLTDNGDLYSPGDLDENSSDTLTFNISFTPVNDAPVLEDFALTTNEDISIALSKSNFTSSYSDVDFDTLYEVRITELPANGTLVLNATPVADEQVVSANELSLLQYIPDAEYFGNDTIRWNASDGSLYALSDTSIFITVNPVNDIPIAVDDAFSVDEDNILGDTVLNNDTGLGDGFTLSVIDQPDNGTLNLNPDGTFDYTPNADYHGPDSFIYRITDIDTETSDGTVSITVNPIDDIEPLAVNDTLTTNEDVVLNANVMTLDQNLTDYPVLVTSNTDPEHGSASIDPNGELTYDPDLDYHGKDSLQYTITDQDGETSQAWIFITVLPLSDVAPLAVNDTLTTNEDVVLNANVMTLDENLTDYPVLVTSKTDPEHGFASIDPNGDLTYIPDLNYHGKDSLQYTITDQDGESSQAWIFITVLPIDDIEPLAVNDTLTTNEDVVLNANVMTLDENLTDYPVLVTSNTTPEHGSATIDPNGDLTYIPDLNYYGSDSLRYTITDEDGETSQAWIFITVLPVSDTAPTANNDTLSTNEDIVLNWNLMDNDEDLTDYPVFVTSNTTPANGTITLDSIGEFTYTPDANYYGKDSLEYTLTDYDGETSSAWVWITINPVSDAAPIAENDTISTNEDTDISGTVMGNDKNLIDQPILITAHSDPSNGTVSIDSAGNYTYSPNTNYHGSDSFTYTITDQDGQSDQAFVLITVLPIDDIAPSAVNDTLNTNEDTPVTANVLANDSALIDYPVLVVTHTSPASGTLTLDSLGALSFTPATDFNGSVTFDYTIEDVDGDQSTASVLIIVNPQSDTAPLAVNDNYTIDEDDTLSANVMTLDQNLVDVPVLLTNNTAPAHGTLDSIDDEGNIVYIPNENYYGTDSFTYTITDFDGESSTATVTITINPVNDVAPVAKDDEYFTPEDTPLVDNVMANDSALIDYPVIVVSFTPPSNGTFNLLDSDGSFNYQPDPNFHGTDTLTYTIEDQDGQTSTAEVIIVVNPVNDVNPSAVGDTYTINEDDTLSVNLMSNDSALIDYPVIVTAYADPANGTIIQLDAEGNLVYVPTKDYHGSDSFTYTITDSDGQSSTATVSITILPVDDIAPIANIDTFFIAEDNLLSGVNLMDNDSNLVDQPVTVTANTTPANGTFNLLTSDGDFDYQPDQDYHGTDTLTYTITDVDGQSSTAIVYIVVSPLNDVAPKAVADTFLISEDQLLTGVNLMGNDTNLVDQPVFVTAYADPTNGTINFLNTDGELEYLPDPDFHGSDSFTYTITDQDGQSSTATVLIFISPLSDTAPVAVADTFYIAEDSLLTAVNLMDNDTNLVDQPVLVSAYTDANDGTIVSLDSLGNLTYQPNAHFNGEDSFSYTITDNDGESSSATVILYISPVNDGAPLAVEDNFTVNEEDTLIAELLNNDSGLLDEPITVAIVASPVNGTVLSINNQGTLEYLPNTDYSGLDSLIYSVTDQDGENDTAWVFIQVLPLNDGAPDAVDDDFTINEDDTLVANIITRNDQNLVDQPVIVSGFSTPAKGALTVEPDGKITYIPEADFYGTVSFTYTLTDQDGESDNAEVTINVLPVDDGAPDAIADYYTLNEDEDISGNVMTLDENLIDQPVLMVQHTATPNGTLNIQSDGNFTYEPKLNYYGNDSAYYVIEDHDGDRDSAYVYFTILPVNDVPPIAVNDTLSVAEDNPLTYNVMSNDLQLIDSLVKVSSYTLPVNGQLTGFDSLGEFTYQPDPDFYGEDSLTYTLTDADGEQSTATVYISVIEVNDGSPTAVNDNFTTLEDTPLYANILKNDYLGLDLPVSVTLGEMTAHGELILTEDDSIDYTPDPHYFGSDRFTYILTDANGDSDTAIVRITVTPVNDGPPVAENDTIYINEDQTTTGELMENDWNLLDTLVSVTNYSQPEEGIVDVQPDGSFTYTPAEHVYGTLTFTYEITDRDGESDDATVYIHITPVDDGGPLAVNDTLYMMEDQAVSDTLLLNDENLFDYPVIVSNYTEPSNGTITEMDLSGRFTYQPNTRFSGTDSFEYTITDNDGQSSTATVMLYVNMTNTPPVITSNPDTVIHEDESYLYTFTFTDADPTDDHTVTAVELPEWLTFNSVDDHTAELTGTPENKDVGLHSVSLMVSDQEGASDTQDFFIRVINVNDLPTAIYLLPNEVRENEAIGTLVGKLYTDDVDKGDAHQYQFIPGEGDEGNNAFTLDEDQLLTAEVFDAYQQDEYSIRVRSTDSEGAQTEAVLTVKVLDVNSNPDDLKLSNQQIEENQPTGTFVGLITARDQDENEQHTFTLSQGDGDADNASFSIVADSLFTAQVFNYEEKNQYTVRLKVQDKRGAIYSRSVMLNILDINDQPTDILLSADSVKEEQPEGSLVALLEVIDEDVWDKHRFDLVEGDNSEDNHRFKLQGDSLLIRTPLDFGEKAIYFIRVRATDSLNTHVEKAFKIEVLPDLTLGLEIPTAFTPNSDGENDVWEIGKLGSHKDVFIEIYNRLGQIVFRSEGYESPWDGTRNGNDLPADTYFYIISLPDTGQEYKGSVMLIRN